MSSYTDILFASLKSNLTISPTEKLFIGGDCNGHIGSFTAGYGEVHGGFGLRDRNKGDTSLLDFARAFELVIVNSIFPKREEHLVTFRSMVANTQIDYPLLKRCDRGLCEDYKEISSKSVGIKPKKKHDASVGPSSSPPHKKRKQQLIDPSTAESPISHVSVIPQTKFPPTGKTEIKETILHIKKPADSKSYDLSSLRKDLNSFKDYVMGEFTSLRTLINENFKKIFEHVKANHNTEKVYQIKKYTGRHDGGIQMSSEPNLHDNPKIQTQSDVAVGENSE
uniref:Craniofacial development protein 2-like n=1 Tax=Nicotiana tabacum TaxID=4097 RepID=A0A1S4BJS0_TOBAC